MLVLGMAILLKLKNTFKSRFSGKTVVSDLSGKSKFSGKTRANSYVEQSIFIAGFSHPFLPNIN